MAQGAKTALFTKAVLNFLQPELANETIDLFKDNQGAIAIAENSISGGRTEHIDVRYHFIRELVERKVLNMQYTESSNQHADILTKPLGQDREQRPRCSQRPCWISCSQNLPMRLLTCLKTTKE